jgi:hypothetical protein
MYILNSSDSEYLTIVVIETKQNTALECGYKAGNISFAEHVKGLLDYSTGEIMLQSIYKNTF